MCFGFSASRKINGISFIVKNCANPHSINSCSDPIGASFTSNPFIRKCSAAFRIAIIISSCTGISTKEKPADSL